MKNYEFYVDDNNKLVYIEVDDDKHKRLYGESAYKMFDKVMHADNRKYFKVRTEGNDKVLTKDVVITIKDYNTTMSKIYEFKKKGVKKAFIKAAVGLAGAVTIGVIATSLIKLDEKEHILPDIETIQEDDSVEIIPLEQEINEYVESLANSSTEVLPPSDNIAYVDATARYDEQLDYNVSLHKDNIEKACNKWGVDPNLMTDIFKQESSGGTAKNIGQVQFESWHDMKLVCYNFEKGKYQTIILTNDSSKYKRGENEPEYVFISEEEMKNPYTAISASTLILSYIYNHDGNRNLTRSVVMYNQGMTAADKVYQEQARVENIPYEELINDETNTRYAEYSYVLDKKDKKGNKKKHGDPLYIPHVFSQSSPTFNLDDGKEYTMRYFEDNTEKANTTRYQSSNTKRIASMY